MKIDTTRFGNIEIAEESIVHMPDGMLGFEASKRFVLLEDRPDTAFKWLQAVDDPALAFIVVDPMEFFPEYEIELPDEQAESLGLGDPCDAIMLTTVTVGSDGKITTNLLGPVIMNCRTLRAAQIVLQDDRYKPKHVICELPRMESQPEQAKAA
jgi:flagellar assembly factor FliW